MRHFIRLVKCIRILGLINGFAVFYYYLHHRMRLNKNLIRKIKLKTLPEPIWLRPGIGDWILMERIFLDKEYDAGSIAHQESLEKRADDICRDGRQMIIIDCGANIGFSSIWLATKFPNAMIIAIEPEPKNFAILQMNASHYKNIKPLNMAIAGTEARVSLSNHHGTPWAWRTHESENGQFQAVTIAKICRDHSSSELFAVKMDVEGFETNVFLGDDTWIDNLPLLMFEMHDWMIPWSGSGHSFFAALSKHRRDYVIKGENVFSYSHSALIGSR